MHTHTPIYTQQISTRKVRAAASTVLHTRVRKNAHAHSQLVLDGDDEELVVGRLALDELVELDITDGRHLVTTAATSGGALTEQRQSQRDRTQDRRYAAAEATAVLVRVARARRSPHAARTNHRARAIGGAVSSHRQTLPDRTENITNIDNFKKKS